MQLSYNQFNPPTCPVAFMDPDTALGTKDGAQQAVTPPWGTPLPGFQGIAPSGGVQWSCTSKSLHSWGIDIDTVIDQIVYPPKILTLKPNSQCDGIWKSDLWDVSRL